MREPFMIKCVMCKGEFDETLLSSKRMCDTCTIQKQIDKVKNERQYRKQTHGEIDVSITCKYCKKNFLAYTKARIYCSDTCRNKWHNIPDMIEATEEHIERLVLKLEKLRSILD
jgi:RecJ-like exonuclease